MSDYNGLGRELNPFLLLDYVAPYEFALGHEHRGVAAHPHKGFETVNTREILQSLRRLVTVWQFKQIRMPDF
ncbi:pirin-related protein [Rhodopirellula maiorica SM1]|uniref:Pirin-related protein n=1 Tax=Rhodopirellula maiorica SM1 TaxID=1265738 RepID=M5S8F5_9BACT|nr:pirin family protein [Rhodopirellula maiorica]EMI22454.1 pirin-related protein [Rhodopirellula maiorica SM1]